MNNIIKFFIVIAVILLGIFFYAGTLINSKKVTIVNYADLGNTQVVDGGKRGVVLFLSSNKNNSSALLIAKFISLSGKIVAVVNIDYLLEQAKKQHVACINHVTLLDVYSQFLQQQFQFSSFSKPWLMGLGEGAAYAKLISKQASAGIFTGAIAWIEKDTVIKLPAVLCGDTGSNNQLTLLEIQASQIILDKKQWLDQSSSIGSWVHFSTLFFREKGNSTVSAITNLPLIELPATSQLSPDYVTVIMSGDGGWANIDKDIANELNSQGMAVLGWNSLRYFWQAKEPNVMATDLSTVMSYYQKKWQKSKVLLIGFSLGADVMPFMFNALPIQQKSNVIGMVLLSPSHSVDFQFHISDWVGSNAGEEHLLKPEIEKMQTLPIVCIYGKEDEDTVCPSLQNNKLLSIKVLPGDHHFNGDYQAVIQLIKQFVNQ